MDHRLIRAFLFDLDGVVVFTDRFHQLGWQTLAGEQGWDFPDDLAHSLRGISRMESLDRILAHNGIEKSDDERQSLADRKNSVYVNAVATISLDDVVPGALDFIRRTREAGVRTALCSASKNAPAVLESLGIGPLFDVVVCGLDIQRSKPDPEVFSLAAERLGVPPFHCMVFEDAVSGIEAARRGGMKAIGIGTPEAIPNAAEVLRDFRDADLDAILSTGRLHRIHPEPWTVTQTSFRKARENYWESLFALSNGRIGVRGSLEESAWPDAEYPATFHNGVFARKPYEHLWKLPGFAEGLEMMLGLVNWTRVELEVDGEALHPDITVPGSHRRRLDLADGVLVREGEFRPSSGAGLRFRTTRLVSMVRRNTAALRYQVEALGPCRVVMTTETSIPDSHWHLKGTPVVVAATNSQADEDSFTLDPADGPHSAAAVTVSKFSLGATSVVPELRTADRSVSRRVEVELNAGDVLVLEKNLFLLTTIDAAREVLAGRALDGALRDAADGFGTLLEEHRQWWRTWWPMADITIDGCTADQQAVRFNLFQLRQSFPEHPALSIGANFLTGDKYCGHVFWDTEMYISQPALYTEPRIVKPLLLYRHGLLDKARKRAREVGNTGALFAWNSISGEECATVFEASTAEYHLVSAVAWAVHRYVELTGDEAFLWEFGAEILFETARFLEDLGGYVPLRGGKFCINAVCGPDEYNCGVNNNTYTNVMAQWHLGYAAQVYDRMRSAAPEKLAALARRCGFSGPERDGWQRAAEAMLIPWHGELGIHPQDDNFLNLEPVDMTLIPMHTDIREKFHPLKLWRTQVCKQADIVLMLLVQSHQFPREVKEADYDFYEARTNHGSSLSACIHAVIAAELGRVEEAYRFFVLSAHMDLNDFKSNVAGGLHSACMGGTWMAVVNGFGGMRDEPGGLRFSPRLPAAWEGCTFRVLWRGSRIEVESGRHSIRYRLIEGPEVWFMHHETPIRLSSEPVEFPATRGFLP